ncbi:T9SS type A sorting domain-containing protein [bacterium]|nr:T9SS type A sorting domain-containing protein [bacterium]
MKTAFSILLLLVITLPLWAQPQYEVTLIREYPSPAPNPVDLKWSDGLLWVCTYDSIYALQLSDTVLEVVRRHEYPFEFLLGIEVLDREFYITVGWYIYLFNEDFVPIDSCAPPELPPISAQITSLAFAEQELYVAHSAIYGWTINRVDYESCHATDEISDGQEDDVRGLAWDGSHFWLSNTSWIIFQIDPATGERIGWFAAPRQFPYGLDWDGSYFWITYPGSDIIQQVAITTGGVADPDNPIQIPGEVEISSVYPNPFNGELRIQYHLNSISGGQLVIYNITGREIRIFNLTTTFNQSALGVVTWDGCDRFGKRVSSGIYFIALKTPREMATKKVLFMK